MISYILLRGKCFYCHAAISKQYLIVEFLAAILPIIITIHFGLSPSALMLFLFTWGLIALGFID